MPSDGTNYPNDVHVRIAVVGWTFVVIQFLLIAALIFSGPADHWPVPGWLRLASWGLFGVGLALMAVAALRLGWSLTPTPVPRASGQLKTDGLYRWSRHPIYSGLLVVVVAVTIRSGSLPTVAIAVATVAFFNVKAAWEEQQLQRRYPDYSTYAARTPRFVPRIRQLSGGGQIPV